MVNSSRHWEQVALELARDHTVVAPDLIGHGDSATPRGDYSLGAHAAVIRDLLGLRLEHTNRIDVPIYAFQTDLTDGGVLRGANNLVERAKTKRKESMLVEGAPQASHLDPLTAAPGDNEFLRTVDRFITKKTR